MCGCRPRRTLAERGLRAVSAAVLLVAFVLCAPGALHAQSDSMQASIERQRAPRENEARPARLRKAGRRQEAVAAYRGLLAQRPTGALHVELAELLLELGRSAEAVVELQRALALEPERSDYRFALARACERAGKRDCALREYWALLKEAPHPEAEARLSALGVDPYSHPYPFAPDSLRAGDIPVWQRSGPGVALGVGTGFASLGVQLSYWWAPAPGAFALVPYAAAGVLTGGDGAHALPAFAGGAMATYGGRLRWLLALGYGAWGRSSLMLFGRVVAERALYGVHLEAGQQWTYADGFFVRWSLGAVFSTDRYYREDNRLHPALSLGLGFRP